WDVAPPGASTELAQWSTEHFQQHGRPLRLAVDARYWQNYFENYPEVKRLQTYDPEKNEVEKTIMFQIMTLLELSIHLIFVFDGPDSYYHDNADSKINTPERLRLLKDLLNHLGVPFHQAPAEAGPTCVRLQELGVVDAAWTNHSTALTRECQVVVVFKMQNRDWKGISEESVIKHEATALMQEKGLDQSSLVLGLLLGGCEYAKGIPGVSHDTALKIAQKAGRLAKTMYDAFHDDGDKIQMNKW
ncbi:PIN domain-like protein, partial [Sordaria brevicollis]